MRRMRRAALGERRPRDEPAHAVPDQHHVAPRVGVDPRVQLCGERLDAEPPVVGVRTRVESGDRERELQLEGVEPHDAERPQARAAREREARQVARRSLDDVEPQHVVEQPAARADPRAHQPRQDVDGGPAAPLHRACLSRELAELAIAVFAQQLDQLGLALTGREQPLDVLVVQPVDRQPGAWRPELTRWGHFRGR